MISPMSHNSFSISGREMQTHMRLRLRFDIIGEQHFYGLGQGGHGLDRLGPTRRLWNAHVNHGPGGDIAIPLLLSTAATASSSTIQRFALIVFRAARTTASPSTTSATGTASTSTSSAAGSARGLATAGETPRPGAAAAALGARLHAVTRGISPGRRRCARWRPRSATRRSPATR